MIGVRAPKTKKSYHSKEVPAAEAMTTVAIEALRGKGADFDSIATSLIAAPFRP
jgi:hypothetical protein